MVFQALGATPRNLRLPSNQRREHNTRNTAGYCQKDRLCERLSPDHAVVLARHEFMMPLCLF
jgi:hypothetical protein